jgi:hypothetical protein
MCIARVIKVRKEIKMEKDGTARTWHDSGARRARSRTGCFPLLFGPIVSHECRRIPGSTSAVPSTIPHRQAFQPVSRYRLSIQPMREMSQRVVVREAPPVADVLEKGA